MDPKLLAIATTALVLGGAAGWYYCDEGSDCGRRVSPWVLTAEHTITITNPGLDTLLVVRNSATADTVRAQSSICPKVTTDTVRAQ